MAPEPQEFENVTLYTRGNVVWSNIVRVDVSRARIWIARYAQFRERAFVEFIRKGKRKAESLVCDYLVVVPTAQAIDPDDLFLPSVKGVDETRYGVADSRWRTDFEDKLHNAKVPILADYRHLQSEFGPSESHEEEKEILNQQISTPVGSSRPAKGNEISDFEEGVRYQAERSFFQRNSRLAEEAKKLYGCICQVCGFDFVSTYGDLGEGFAEVHHLNPLSERPPEEWTEEILSGLDDVAVLCANCHRMIHRQRPALSIGQLRAILFDIKNRSES